MDKVSGITELDFLVENLIQYNCRKMNTMIGCYDWEDNAQDQELKTLILYAPEKIYRLDINKRYINDLTKFEELIVNFIRKTVPN